MKPWRNIPLLRFLLPFILGIYLGTIWQINPNLVSLFGVLLSIAATTIFIYLRKKINRSLQLIASIAVSLIFLALGFLNSFYHNEQNDQNHFSKIIGENESCTLLLHLNEQPEAKEKTIKCNAKVKAIVKDSEQYPVSGNLLLYLEKDSVTTSVNYGQYVLAKVKLSKIESPKNPYQFDFSRYAHFQNLHYQAYIKSTHLIALPQYKRTVLKRIAFSLRDYFLQTFDKYIPNEAQRGVAQAIVFGYKQDIDNSWLEGFSHTGTLHVLAVSGLHVGVIYLLFAQLFFLGRGNKKVRLIKTLAIVTILFLYALLTGFAPSVSRAALMFSFVAIAKVVSKSTFIYNTLAAACLILLIINPFNLFLVGFQFSFLAVWGIVLLQPPIKALWPQSDWLADKAWSLVAVSIAAQVATLPLGLYYFHQFPTFFMLANLVVIPFITIILYAGVALAFFSLFSTFLAKWIGAFIAIYVQSIADVVFWIESLPFSFFERIHITFPQVWAAYVMLAFVCLAVGLKNYSYFMGTAFTLLIFLAFDFHYSQKAIAQKELIHFFHPSEPFIGYKNGKALSILTSQKMANDPKIFEHILEPYLVHSRIQNWDFQILEAPTKKSKGDIVCLQNGLWMIGNKTYFFSEYGDLSAGFLRFADFIWVGNAKSWQFYDDLVAILQDRKVITVSKNYKFLFFCKKQQPLNSLNINVLENYQQFLQ